MRREWSKPAHWPGFLKFLGDLRQRRFDLVVDLQGLFRSGLITGATGARRRVGLSDAREGARLFYTECVRITARRMHAVDRYLLAAQHLDAGREPIQFPLGHPKAVRERIDKLFQGNSVDDGANLVAVNPGARWASKLWPADRFAALAGAVMEEIPNARIVLVGGPQEREKAESIMAAMTRTETKPPPVNAAGWTSLSELTEILRRCAVLVTNDSGPMHIAAAVGTPVVALFGATDPAMTGPYPCGGVPHKVLRSGISCSPCLKPHCHHTPRMECMTLIEPTNVLAEVIQILRHHHSATV
jgi:heptosyltransferase-1